MVESWRKAFKKIDAAPNDLVRWPNDGYLRSQRQIATCYPKDMGLGKNCLNVGPWSIFGFTYAYTGYRNFEPLPFENGELQEILTILRGFRSYRRGPKTPSSFDQHRKCQKLINIPLDHAIGDWWQNIAVVTGFIEQIEKDLNHQFEQLCHEIWVNQVFRPRWYASDQNIGFFAQTIKKGKKCGLSGRFVVSPLLSNLILTCLAEINMNRSTLSGAEDVGVDIYHICIIPFCLTAWKVIC